MRFTLLFLACFCSAVEAAAIHSDLFASVSYIYKQNTPNSKKSIGGQSIVKIPDNSQAVSIGTFQSKQCESASSAKETCNSFVFSSQARKVDQNKVELQFSWVNQDNYVEKPYISKYIISVGNPKHIVLDNKNQKIEIDALLRKQ